MLALSLAVLVPLGGCQRNSSSTGSSSVRSFSLSSAKNTPLKDLMLKMNGKDGSVRTDIEKALDKDDPEWSDIQMLASQYLQGANDASELNPPKNPDQWKANTKKYVDAAKHLDEAAQAKDKKKMAAAQEVINNCCADCHRAHK
jgi:hypothetical protein